MLTQANVLVKKLVLSSLAVAINLNFSVTQALDCQPIIAQIHKVATIEQIGILRVSQGKTHEWASLDNRELCAGDVVIVPKTIPQLKISYYSHPPLQQILTAGERYQVIALDNPCGGLCKFQEAIQRLWTKLWKTQSSLPTQSTGWRGPGWTPYIYTPLADGESTREPFYLFARQGAIPLVWQGGKPPYRLTVKDATGKMVVQTTTEARQFSLTTLNPEPGLEYRLTIQTTEDKTCQTTNSKICQKPLIFTVPPFPLDSRTDQSMKLATLWGDCERNWRLEIWRQLQAMPDSQQKQVFMAHLQAADVSAFDKEIGLCQ